MPFIRTLRLEQVPPGAIQEFETDGKAIAIANVEGKIYAINGVCLHRGGPLGEGELEGPIVTCPWHGWQYNVTTGRVAQNEAIGVDCYAVEVRGDDIFVDIA